MAGAASRSRCCALARGPRSARAAQKAAQSLNVLPGGAKLVADLSHGRPELFGRPPPRYGLVMVRSAAHDWLHHVERTPSSRQAIVRRGGTGPAQPSRWDTTGVCSVVTEPFARQWRKAMHEWALA